MNKIVNGLNAFAATLAKAAQGMEKEMAGIVIGIARIIYEMVVVAKSFVKYLVRCSMVAIVIYFITATFYPQFATRFPAIYGWFDGCMQTLEFLYKASIKWLYALFTGKLEAFDMEFSQALNEKFQMLDAWVNSLQL